MYKISVSKELFNDILLKKTILLTKENNKYWKKELLNPTIIDNKINYSIKQFEKIVITNGLGDEKPQLVIECKKVDYSLSKDLFEFHLGKILEQKNTNLKEDYKDTLIEQLLQEKIQLEDKINRDHLTQVYNRRKMYEDLKSFINHKNSFLLTTIFIDADRFKGINDNFGHEAGDKTLVYLAKKLQKYAKSLNGEVYRYGGEEFVILCFLAKDRLIQRLNELREDIKTEKVPHTKRDISVTVSMGVSFYSDCENAEDMIKRADECLYHAKDKGRDRIEIA
jgi:diguanylate cyclase (GGDEF)-like protein